MTETKSITIKDALNMVRNAQQQLTESQNRIEAMKKEKGRINPFGETNIIFAVDATFSRKKFWKESMKMQNNLFSVIKDLDLTLNVQLVNYGGEDFNTTPWHNSASTLQHYMKRIQCQSGGSQIENVLTHALSESSSRDVHALIFVGDSCEETQSRLNTLATQLKKNKVFLFVFDDGGNSTSRHTDTGKIFNSMTENAGGICAPFSTRDMSVLREYFRISLATASRDLGTLKNPRLSIKTNQGKMLLERSMKLLSL